MYTSTKPWCAQNSNAHRWGRCFSRYRPPCRCRLRPEWLTPWLGWRVVACCILTDLWQGQGRDSGFTLSQVQQRHPSFPTAGGLLMNGFWTRGVKTQKIRFGCRYGCSSTRSSLDCRCQVLVTLSQQRHTHTNHVCWKSEWGNMGVSAWASHLTSAALTGASPALIASAALKAGLGISIAYGAD